MVPFQGDKQSDAGASRHYLRAVVDSGSTSTKADGSSAGSFDHSGYNISASFTARHHSRGVAEFLG